MDELHKGLAMLRDALIALIKSGDLERMQIAAIAMQETLRVLAAVTAEFSQEIKAAMGGAPAIAAVDSSSSAAMRGTKKVATPTTKTGKDDAHANAEDQP